MANPSRTHRVLGVDPYGVATVAALLALLVGGAWAAMATVINHDSAWYLHATKLFLHGGRLYEDIIEVNPPLAFFLTLPPVWLADVTGLFPVDVFFAWVFALMAVSLGLSWAVVRAFQDISPAGQRGLVIASFFAIALSTWQQFGQREHFLLILVLPYLFLAAVRIAGNACGRGLALTVGVFAALGFALKPYFLLVPFAVEIYRIAKSGNFRQTARPETLTLAGLVTLYAVAVVVVTPAYVTKILPWALEVYFAYTRPIADVLVLGINEALFLFVAAGLFFCIRNRSPEHAIAAVFLIASAAFYVIYAGQMKGWSYHRFPISGTALVVLSAALIFAVRRDASPRAVRRPIFLLATLVSLIWSVSWLLNLGSYKNPFFDRSLPAVARNMTPGAPIFVFTTNVSHGFPLVTYAGAGWSSRFSTLWTLPGIVRRRAEQGTAINPQTRENLRTIEQYTFDTVIGDLVRRPPALIFVDMRERKPYFGDVAYDYVAHFSTNPRFAALWSGYERIADLGGYHLYRRRAADKASGSKAP